VDIEKLRPELIEYNQQINWYPEHLKKGRFGKGLETAPDWNISRSRYWGTPMPIWKGEKSGKLRVIESRQDLKKWAVSPEKIADLTDIHREFVDDIEVWVDDAKTEKGKRIPEVFDCWVESGSMPFASLHYPFNNKDKFEQKYPAQFIVEYIAQTRAWFYTVHVMSAALFGKPAYENALTTGNILAADGRKMSKSKKNFPDPEPFFEKYGVDALRFYLMSSVVMKGDNVNFSEAEVKEVYQKLINILWNTFSFYKLYINQPVDQQLRSKHVLDRWIVSKTNSLIKDVAESLDEYDTTKACRLIQEFVTDLSTWYLRRSRERLRTDQSAQKTFAWVLDRLIHVMAPFTPFLTETIYQNLHQTDQSIHLSDWPVVDESLIDLNLEQNMSMIRKIVESLHSIRQEKGIKVRQPLATWSVDLVHAQKLENQLELLQVVSEETNIKNYAQLNADWYQPNTPNNTVHSIMNNKTNLGDLTVYLDIEVTPALKAEGEARELVRQIQQERKKLQIDLNDQIEVSLPNWPKELEAYIKEKTLAVSLVKAEKFAVRSV
jgi:isoleucyl-tRNA synthetase